MLDTTTVSSGQNFDRRMVESAADVLEHADHAVALHAGRGAGRSGRAEHLPGIHGRHDERRGRAGRHRQRLRQPQHGQQLHDRRRAATTASAAASPVRPNSDQIEEMRIETSNFDAVPGARHRAHHLDDDARRHEHAARHRRTTRTGTTGSTRPTCSRRWRSSRTRARKTRSQGPGAHRRVHARRSARDPEGDQRPQQAVLLRQLLDVERLGARAARRQRPPCRPTQKELDGDFSDLLQLPTGAGASTPAGAPVSDLRSADGAARSGCVRARIIRDPFPGNIIPKNRFMNPDGTYKNPAFALYHGDGAGAEPELPLAEPAADQQLLPRGGARPAAQRPDQRPHRLQPVGQLAASSFAATATSSSSRRCSDWTYDVADPKFQGLHDVARARYSWSVTGTWTKV